MKMAAKVDLADRAYFERVVEPPRPSLDRVCRRDHRPGKSDLSGMPSGLICPYDWPEPFGLVLIESWPVVHRSPLTAGVRSRKSSVMVRRVLSARILMKW